MNKQAWRLIVVNDPALMAEFEAEAMRTLVDIKDAYDRIMSRGGKIYYNAPCMFLIVIDKTHSHAEMDCGILAENVALAATSMGLGNVHCGMAALIFAKDPEKFKKRLGVPEGFEFGLAVLVGKAAAEFKQHEPDMTKVSYVK